MQQRMIFFVAAVAVILAIAGFLFINYLSRGGEQASDDPLQQAPGDPAGETVPPGFPVIVDNTTVYLQTVPERSVSLVPPPATDPIVVEEPPTPEPTATDVVIEQTIIQPTTPPIATGTDAVVFIDYVVQPGDTLYSIADRQGTSIELMAVHGISAENLAPGTTLRLPVANVAYCSGAQTYVVRPGDTVFSLSRRFNTTTQAISAANGLDANFRINVAQVLCIP